MAPSGDFQRSSFVLVWSDRKEKKPSQNVTTIPGRTPDPGSVIDLTDCTANAVQAGWLVQFVEKVSSRGGFFEKPLVKEKLFFRFLNALWNVTNFLVWLGKKKYKLTNLVVVLSLVVVWKLCVRKIQTFPSIVGWVFSRLAQSWVSTLFPSWTERSSGNPDDSGDWGT